MNSTFRARWLASSEVISQVLFTSEQQEKKTKWLLSLYFLKKVTLWTASYSACVVYTKTIIHLSVGESGGYLPPLRWIIVNYWQTVSSIFAYNKNYQYLQLFWTASQKAYHKDRDPFQKHSILGGQWVVKLYRINNCYDIYILHSVSFQMAPWVVFCCAALCCAALCRVIFRSDPWKTNLVFP